MDPMGSINLPLNHPTIHPPRPLFTLELGGQGLHADAEKEENNEKNTNKNGGFIGILIMVH